MTNRARTDTLAKILETVNDHGEDGDGVSQTTIRYEVFLSGAQLKQYLIALSIHGLLSYNPTSHRYNVTEKGLRFLNFCHEMDDMINEEQQQQLQSLSSLSKQKQQSWMKSER
jgi:predicted transcriptional regulator